MKTGVLIGLLANIDTVNTIIMMLRTIKIKPVKVILFISLAYQVFISSVSSTTVPVIGISLWLNLFLSFLFSSRFTNPLSVVSDYGRVCL